MRNITLMYQTKVGEHCLLSVTVGVAHVVLPHGFPFPRLPGRIFLNSLSPVLCCLHCIKLVAVTSVTVSLVTASDTELLLCRSTWWKTDRTSVSRRALSTRRVNRRRAEWTGCHAVYFPLRSHFSTSSTGLSTPFRSRRESNAPPTVSIIAHRPTTELPLPADRKTG